MQLIQCKCQNCGNTLKLDLDNFQAECPSCGSKIIMDSKMLEKIMLEKTKNDRLKIQADLELEKQRIWAENNKLELENEAIRSANGEGGHSNAVQIVEMICGLILGLAFIGMITAIIFFG